MGSQRVQMKGVLPWLDRWACRGVTRDFCSSLAALVGLVQNIFFSPYTISFPLSPLPNKLGKLPCRVACLFVCVSGFSSLQGPALSGLSDLILKKCLGH